MIAVLLSVALAAPPPLRLADLLREARDKNPDLKSATARVRAAQSAISPAGALDDPMLMVQLWNTPVDFSTVPVMVQLSQNVPLGGKRGARTDAARADAAMVEAELAQKQRDVETQVASAYFDLFLADRTQEIDDELETILNVVLRASQARLSTGKAEQVELLRAQAALIQVRSERETAIDRRRSAWARLAALLDRDPASPPGSTTQPGVIARLPDAATLTERALRERPELAGSRAGIAGAQAEERLARANRIPDVNLFAAEMRHIDLHHQLIPIARQAVQSAESSFAAGRTDFTMVLDSARELRMHEMDLATHLAAYEQRLAELQRAVGSDLGLAQAAEAGHEERH